MHDLAIIKLKTVKIGRYTQKNPKGSMALFKTIVIIVMAASVGAEIKDQDAQAKIKDNCDMMSLMDRIIICEDEHGSIIPLKDTRYVIPSHTSCNMTCPGKEGLATSIKICLDGKLLGADINCEATRTIDQTQTNRRIKRGVFSWIGDKLKKAGDWVVKTGKKIIEGGKKVVDSAIDMGKKVLCWGLDRFCKGPPRDDTDPEVTCPSDIRKRSDSHQTSAVVQFGRVTATDNKDGTVTPRQIKGPKSGWRFGEGRTEVCFSATDRAGNSARCCSDVNVYVVTCPAPPSITNGAYRYSPSNRYIMGGKARYTCYRGYEFDDLRHNMLTCTAGRSGSTRGQWDKAAPICKKKQCPVVSNIKHGTVKCTDSFLFKSRCEYICAEGFDVRQGQSRVRVCGYRGQWLAQEPQCIDITKPRVKRCPSNIITYTEKSVSYTTVTWLTPQYTDNSAVSSKLVSSLGPGSNFSVGTHRVEYRGVDEAGNVGGACRFSVVVKRLTCPTIYPRPKQLVTCSEGYSYGATCSMSCYDGTELEGAPSTECVRAGTTPRVYWDYVINGGQPECAGRICPDLNVPENGALICDAWIYGSVCQMFCNENFDIARADRDSGLHDLRVCNLDGKWNKFNKPVPNCAKRKPSYKKVLAEMHYFAGDCCDPDVQTEISQRFVKAVNSSEAYGILCTGHDRCSVANVDIQCGPSCGTRRKRNLEDMEMRIAVELRTNFTIGGRASFIESVNLFEEVLDIVEQIASSIDLGLSTRFSSFSRGMTEQGCENGLFPSYLSFGCVGCGFGQYFNQTVGGCNECPLHTYQDKSSSTRCTQCPYGKQTERVAVEKETGCKDVCKPGWFSTNGFEPCTPCPLGSFTTNLASIGCTLCPAGKTTMLEASDKIDVCTVFDLLFTDGGEAGYIETTRNISKAETFDMTIAYKMLPEIPFINDSPYFTVWQGGNDIVQLAIRNTSIVGHILGCSLDDLDIETRINNWNSHIINFTQTLNDVTIVWYDTLNDEQVFVTCDIGNATLQGGNVTFTIGRGLVGKLTDFNVYSGNMKDLPLQKSQCANTNMGDIIKWSDIAMEKLESCVLVESDCELEDACKSNPCGNHTCTDEVHSFTCDCDEGFTGDLCDVNIDDCLHNSCDEGSICLDEVNGYTCLCGIGTRGEFCEEEIVNGGWSDWSSLSTCSASCEGGEAYRNRSCTQPVPDPDGEPCEGNSTETEECNIDACPVCPPLNIPANGASDCEQDGDFRNCTIYCNDGYDFTYRPPDVIYCGSITGYEWSFVHEENPFKELPECEPIDPPKKLSVETQIRYTADQEGVCNDETIKAMNKILNQNIANVQCGDNYYCDIEEIQIRGCDPTKRSADPPVIYITVYAQEAEGGDEPIQQTDDEAVDAFANSVIALREAALVIQQHVTSGAYNVTIGGTTYYVEGHSFADAVQCAPGMTYFKFYCVPCGRGTYEDADHVCSRCPIGTFQDEMKQTTCKPCPAGWTTRGTGAKMDADCSVPLPTSSASIESYDHTTAVNDIGGVMVEKNGVRGRLDDLNLGLPVGLVVALLVLGIVVSVFIIWKYKCGGDKIDKIEAKLDERATTSVSQRDIKLHHLKSSSVNTTQHNYVVPSYAISPHAKITMDNASKKGSYLANIEI